MERMFITKLKSVNLNNWMMGHDENYMMLQGSARSDNCTPFITDPRSVILSDIYAQLPPITHEFVTTCFDKKQLNHKQKRTSLFHKKKKDAKRSYDSPSNPHLMAVKPTERYVFHSDYYPSAHQCNQRTPTKNTSDRISIECYWETDSEFHISVQSSSCPDGIELAYFMESYEENNIAYLPVASYFSENKYGGTSEYLLTTDVFDSFEQATEWLNAFKTQHPEFKPHAFDVRFFEKSELPSDEWFDMNMQMLKKTNGYSEAWKDAFDLHFNTMYYNMFDNAHNCY